MITFLSRYLIYSYNDMAADISRYFSFHDGLDHLCGLVPGSRAIIDAITNNLFSAISRLVGPILTNNILVIINLLATFVTSYFLFKLLVKSRAVGVALSTINSFSLYFIFRVISFTPNLYPVFVFPLLFYLLLRNYNRILISLYVLLVFLISSYYGFFCFVLVIFWEISSLILKQIALKTFFKYFLQFVLPFVLVVVVMFPQLVLQNLPILGKYNKNNSAVDAHSLQVFRPMEDYYNFSFRPWYFVIPPKTSLLFSKLSETTYDRISSTNYYLADDYSKEEMGGTYLGWHFIIGLLVSIGIVIGAQRNKSISDKFSSIKNNHVQIIRFLLISILIMLVSFPPSFTIRGVEIYTPSYLLYYIVPIFRTLVRWAVAIYLLVLIINAYLVQDLYNLMKKTWQKAIFIIGFLSLNFVIFAIKIPVININKPPQEVAFLKKEFPESVPYVVYPKGDYYSIFWIISHEDVLINSVNFVNCETGFDANEFSKNLITPEGIRKFLTYNPKYLIYYKENITDSDLEKISKISPYIKSKEDLLDFFSSNFGFPIFAQNDIFVYKVETK